MPASSFELNRFFICHFSRSLRLLRDRLVIITPSSVSVWTVDATAVWQTNTLTNVRAKNRRRTRSMNSYVEHCRNDIKNMIHWIANTFPITNDKSQIDRVQVDCSANEQRTRHNTKNLTKTECRPKRNHNGSSNIKEKSRKKNWRQTEKRPTWNEWSAAHRDVFLFKCQHFVRFFFGPIAHQTTYEEPTTTTTLNNTFYNRGDEQTTTTKYCPFTISQVARTSGVIIGERRFFLFFIRFSFIVCAHLCSSHIERIAVAVVVVTYCLFVCYCSDAAAAVFCLVSALFSVGFVLDAVLSPPRVVCNKFNAHIHSLTLTDACENTRKRTRDI